MALQIEDLDIPEEYEPLAEYMENMAGMEFTYKRRRELLYLLERIVNDDGESDAE